MLHDPNLHIPARRGRYHPQRAWLGRPGDGAIIRRRRSSGLRWGFRWKQLRILLLAGVLGALAWSQIPEVPAQAPIAAEQAAR